MDMDMPLRYVIQHVFLPPKLPQQDDSSSANDRDLTQRVQDALKSAAALSPDETCWSTLASMTDVLLGENDDSDDSIIPSQRLDTAMLSMKDDGMFWNIFTACCFLATL